MAYSNHATFSIEGSIAGVQTLKDIHLRFERHYMNLAFYTDATKQTLVPISSMTGSVVWSASDNGRQFGTVLVGDNTEGVMTLGTGSYPRPTVRSGLKAVRVDFSGITDLGNATHFELIVNSYGGGC